MFLGIIVTGYFEGVSSTLTSYYIDLR